MYSDFLFLYILFVCDCGEQRLGPITFAFWRKWDYVPLALTRFLFTRLGNASFWQKVSNAVISSWHFEWDYISQLSASESVMKNVWGHKPEKNTDTGLFMPLGNITCFQKRNECESISADRRHPQWSSTITSLSILSPDNSWRDCVGGGVMRWGCILESKL